jgi:AcrR family transcriptional regulator
MGKPTPVTRAREQLRQQQREAMRTLIVDAALALIDRSGIEAATLEGIAQELGLTRQGLYYHFASKEALLAEAALQDWKDVAHAIQVATDAAATAEDALEALVRTYVAHYRGRLERYRLATQGPFFTALTVAQARGRLAEVRPLNNQFYGGTERKLREAQAVGRADPALDPRRLAFVAHLGAMGLLTMKLLVSSVDDPLKYGDDELVAELCRALRASVPQRNNARSAGMG